MTEKDSGPKYVLRLTPLHPFTERQAEIIELLANGLMAKEVSQKLCLSNHTVYKHISGTNNGLFNRSALGIIGIIENATGVRPGRRNWLPILLNDVLFFREVKSK
jgi:DNA-binding CsgD family transcriptional regulator